MKRAECCSKRTSWIVSPVVALTAGRVQSGRRSNRNYVTSATSTVSDTTVATAAMTTIAATMTGDATTATTIGGEEFHSLSNRPHLTSASSLLVYPAKGLGSNAGAFILFVLSCSSCESCNPV